MNESQPRVLIVDQNQARATILEDGLREAGYRDVIVVRDMQNLMRRILDEQPDVILIDLENLNRDVLEQMFQVSRVVQKPVAMFVDAADRGSIEAAVEAGVSAYVVDGLRKERVRDKALDAARAASSDIAATAQICGLPPELVERFFTLFAAHERTVTLFSQGVNQSSAGSDKVNSIINCHLITGRIAREGMGPFSITGQPNAMGGREVGGLATQLAAHLALNNVEHRAAVQEFWN